MWSILIMIGGITFGSQYMSERFFLSEDECQQVADKMVAEADFLEGQTYNVRCEPFRGLAIEPWRVK